MYILDENGRVVFEFSKTAGGVTLVTNDIDRIKIANLIRDAFLFISFWIGRKNG
jgi:hypothetical protein